MGSWISRQSGDSNVSDAASPSAFRYPPKSGNYFGSHFIMGGERFETPQPEQFLFGDNADLNFLGNKPIPFPYPAPQSNEPTKALKALVNIRKESLKLVKLNNSTASQVQSTGTQTPLSYNIEFTFDCDCRCEITIMYFCTEEVTAAGLSYKPKDPKLSSTPIKFKAGANQVYTNSEHIFQPALFSDTELQYDFEKEVFPIVIFCAVLEGDDPRQSHVTTAYIDKYSDGSYSLKPLKQKLFVDGLVYLLQEIYGIENKNASRKFDEEDSDAENAAECVICMCDPRDTLILPCRHLCLCHACADSLRYQANNCPICRAPFRALLQIRAVYRIPPAPVEYSALSPETAVIQMNAIPGYEMVPLLEALNGPFQPSDLTVTSANLARQEAARALNTGEDNNEIRPIAMTVMVAPSPHSDTTKTDDEKPNLESPVGNVIQEKPPRKSSSAKLSKSSSAEAKTPITSDPEDEIHFAEAAEALPDLREFNDNIDTNILSSKFEEKVEESMKPKEDDMELQSIENSPVHTTNVLMIAAIDEFSDEEDTSRARRLMSGRFLSGDQRHLSDSTQSTPKRLPSDIDSQRSSPDQVRFGVRPVPTSVPSTPSNRMAPPGATHSVSTRSSGDSFTSSSSTKQLLPSNSSTSSGAHL